MEIVIEFLRWVVASTLIYATGRAVFNTFSILMQPLWDKLFGEQNGQKKK